MSTVNIKALPPQKMSVKETELFPSDKTQSVATSSGEQVEGQAVNPARGQVGAQVLHLLGLASVHSVAAVVATKILKLQEKLLSNQEQSHFRRVSLTSNHQAIAKMKPCQQWAPSDPIGDSTWQDNLPKRTARSKRNALASSAKRVALSHKSRLIRSSRLISTSPLSCKKLTLSDVCPHYMLQHATWLTLAVVCQWHWKYELPAQKAKFHGR